MLTTPSSLTARLGAVDIPPINLEWVTNDPQGSTHTASMHSGLQDLVGAIIYSALVIVGIAFILAIVGGISYKVGIQPFGRSSGDYIQGALICLIAATIIGSITGAVAWSLRHSLMEGWTLF
ncbi:MAG: hypothetical protein FWD83_00310 [Promicromonosporaceae bacterium]|nr:hypothetical protein [Promicromonosporaceae bacterium]